MSVAEYLNGARQRVSDLVVSMMPRLRRSITQDEERIAIYLRGNTDLYEGLVAIIRSRLEGRASLPVPSDPIVCRGMMERDNELRWLLSRLDRVYRSNPSEPGDRSDAEQPD